MEGILIRHKRGSLVREGFDLVLEVLARALYYRLPPINPDHRRRWLILAGVLLLICFLSWYLSRESPAHRIDRELAWKAVTPYPVPTHGVEVGWLTVPGHTQRVTLYLWGIPKEDSNFDDFEIRGEADRAQDLDTIALAAYNHGSLNVILAEHKAYFVGSDLEDITAAEAIEASKDPPGYNP